MVCRGHKLEDLDRLIDLAKSTQSDLTIGERSIAAPMPWGRRIANRLMSKLVSLLTGFKIKDSQCGLRVMSRKFLEAYKFSSDGFEIETEMLHAAATLKFKLTTERVETIYCSGRKSHVRPVVDIYRFLKFIVSSN